MLIRKSIRITKGNHVPDVILMINLCALSNILALKKDLSEERRDLLHQILDIRLRSSTDFFVGCSENNLGVYYRDMIKTLPPGIARREKCHLATSFTKEAVRISTNLSGPTHKRTLQYMANLVEISSYL
jgi:hypothetical protein